MIMVIILESYMFKVEKAPGFDCSKWLHLTPGYNTEGWVVV